AGHVLHVRNRAMVSALATLAQLELASGSKSITGIDVVRHEQAFEQKNFLQLDAAAVDAAFKKASDHTLSLAALKGRLKGASFLQESLQQQLKEPYEGLRVLIVASSTFAFEHGTDVEPITLAEDCRCRTYHLRFRHTQTDVFDDIGKVLRPLRPRT